MRTIAIYHSSAPTSETQRLTTPSGPSLEVRVAEIEPPEEFHGNELDFAEDQVRDGEYLINTFEVE